MSTKYDGRWIKDNTIGVSHLQPNSVGASQITANAVTSSELANDAVGSDQIASNAVTSAKIAANAVGSSEIANDAVGSDQIASNAVGTSEIAQGAVTGAQLGANAVTQAKISHNAVGSDQIASNAVTTAKIADNNVTVAKLSIDSDIAMGSHKLTGLADGATGTQDAATVSQVETLVGAVAAGTSWHDYVDYTTNMAITGGVTTAQNLQDHGETDGTYDLIEGEFVLSLSDNAIYKIGAGAGKSDRILSSAASSDGDRAQSPDQGDARYTKYNLPDSGVGQEVGAVWVYSGTAYVKISDVNWELAGGIGITDTNGKITATNVEGALEENRDAIDTLEAASLSVNDGISWSGSLSAGTLGLTDNSIAGSKIVDGGIDTTQLAENAVSNAIIADDAVESRHIAGGAIDSNAFFGSGVVTESVLADNAVTSGKIADNSIGQSHLQPDSVDSNALASNAVQTAEISPNAVTNVKIADDSIESRHIADGAIDSNAFFASGVVSESVLADNSVSSGKIADNAVTSDQIASNAVTLSEIADSVKTATSAGAGDAGKLILLDSNGLIDSTMLPSFDEITAEVNEVLTLTSADITAKYKDLTNVSVNYAASQMAVVQGPLQEYGVDFAIKDAGAGRKRLIWDSGDAEVSTGMVADLVAGDKLSVWYEKTA